MPAATTGAPLPAERLGQLSLDTPVQFVKGVGPRLAALLGARGVATVEDLIYKLPFRYEDRSRLRPIQALLAGETATVVAQARTLAFSRTRRGVTSLEMTAGDGSGVLACRWYNAEYLQDRIQSGQTLALFGRVERERGRLVMSQPEFEILEPEPEPGAGSAAAGSLAGSLKLGRIVPVYEAVGALTAGRLRRLIHRALADLPPAFPDPLPEAMRQRLRLPSRRAALEQVHFPGAATPLSELDQARTPAHIRLILEELFCLQAGLEFKRRRMQRQSAPPMAVNAPIRERLKQLLPFHPTQEQKNALREIVADLCAGRPMRRLLQGEVGSGKTIVALQAAAIAIENGYQVALMAPTQILAEQHYLYAQQLLPGYRVRLVTGGRKRRHADPVQAPPQLAIGTQALLEGGFHFDRLGLVVVDEQHRFGVLQRFHLMHKGAAPSHLLVMTATPIPRTLALALYGDLDTSIIRRAPPGAMPVETRAVGPQASAAVYEFVRQRVRAGRQAYCVYPIIEESERLDLTPALRMHERLQRQFPELRVGLLHGRMPADERRAAMAAFRAGAVQILAATTVIEVGVDVPNATLLVVEDADRFGIAQLHQLRGRIGRPAPPQARLRPHPGAGGEAEKAYCFLVHGEKLGETGRRRLHALVRSRDGFELAEEDLKLRGPGEFFGTRQSGLPMFQIAQPLRDQALMELARDEARSYLERASPDEQRRLVQQIQARWQRHYGLVEAG